MKASHIDFLIGIMLGCIIAFSSILIAANSIQADAIKAYQEGKIECQTVGGEFICREVKK